MRYLENAVYLRMSLQMSSLEPTHPLSIFAVTISSRSGVLSMPVAEYYSTNIIFLHGQAYSQPLWAQPSPFRTHWPLRSPTVAFYPPCSRTPPCAYPPCSLSPCSSSHTETTYLPPCAPAYQCLAALSRKFCVKYGHM